LAKIVENWRKSPKRVVVTLTTPIIPPPNTWIDFFFGHQVAPFLLRVLDGHLVRQLRVLGRALEAVQLRLEREISGDRDRILVNVSGLFEPVVVGLGSSLQIGFGFNLRT
jgi:hypothetical protein